MTDKGYGSVEAARAAAAKSFRQERRRGSKRSKIGSNTLLPTEEDVEAARERLRRLAATLEL